MSSDELATLLERATTPAETGEDRGRRAKALAALVPALTRSARTAGIGAVAGGRWLVDEIIELAPRIAFRDGQTLRAHFPGLSDAQIAEALIKHASRTTAALGAAAGGLAAVEFAAPPALLATPIQLAAEMLAVTAVELKLVAELHELAGLPAPGGVRERAGAYLMSWVRRRAVKPQLGAAGLTAVFGTAAKRELRGQVLRRLGRSTTTLAPFLAGAVAGAEVNRRATRGLGETLAAELRGMQPEQWFRQLS
ncbi:hypothetical protein M6D93_10310 [Jatrophihabitans telluris]|uniref:EcsC family protein n=1 Tax=Jatrophihabitans telluris TaxID=2038343 RepID=A0ABY4QS82_9ACTN|nr:hypothetical protein [Jatrophihabitans telluris]UQX86704.1 hypothetical protein M6D93_10310 [Jatrophihabitans telluris]